MVWINEIFGPTIQGEGSAAGRHCMFIRVADCNLECSWCDTAYTWAFTASKAGATESGRLYDKASNRYVMMSSEVIDRLRKLWDVKRHPTTIVISGGEPLMQARDLVPIIQELSQWGNQIHIETAGTLFSPTAFDCWVTQYNVSPKLMNSGNLLSKRRKIEVLQDFAEKPHAWFKFVVQDTPDFGEIDELVEMLNINPNRVMVMPEGVTAERNIEVARRIATHAVSRGYGLSFRTHILLWESTRGK